MSWGHWGRGRTLGGGGSAGPTGSGSSPAGISSSARAQPKPDAPGTSSPRTSGTLGKPPAPTGNWKVDLAKALDAIKRKGDFATHRRYEVYANPGLRVKDTLVALPIDESHAGLIRSMSSQAPFGKGDHTLVDASVRRTWELEPTQFQLSNPAWASFLNKILSDISKQLGLPDVRLEPYKLLLYEKGSFFRAHKDSEKAPGMIATLSISLPSKHEGGEVHLVHSGQRKAIDTSKSIFDINALAWYSDVTHEIKPVTDGHRVVLIYNIIRDQTTLPSSAVSADFFMGQNRHLKEILARWTTQSPNTPRLVYFLEHKYSQTSLRASNLKGRDQAVYEVLESLSGSQGLFLFLGNVTRTESDQYCDGTLKDDDSENDDSDSGDRYGFSGGFRHYYDDDDEIKRGITLSLLCTGDGIAVGHGVEIEKSTILGKPYGGRRPDSEDEGEYRGNTSAPNEFRYHNSAIILVPKDRLSGLVGKDADANALLSIIEADLKSSKSGTEIDSPSRLLAAKFMTSALKTSDPELSMRIALLAWQISNPVLFDAAITACFQLPKKPHQWNLLTEIPKVTAALARETSHQWAGRTVDWDAWLGAYVRGHASLTQLSASLTSLASQLSDEKLRASLSKWRRSAELNAFEVKKSLQPPDYDFIINLAKLRWGSKGWIQNMFMRRLRSAGTKPLVSRVVCSLLQLGREGSLDDVKPIVEKTFAGDVSLIALGRMDLGTIHDQASYDEAKRFTELVEECLKSGLHSMATELMRLSLASLKSPTQQHERQFLFNGKVPTLAQDFVNELLDKFKAVDMPSNDAARELIEYVLRNHIVRSLPRYPPPPQGWKHRLRGCDKCKHCTELDAFLASSAERAHGFLRKGPRIVVHLQERLSIEYRDRENPVAQNEFFRVEKSSVPGKEGSYDLTVTKMGGEYASALKKYAKEYENVEARVVELRDEYMARLLGSELYGELVMLNKLQKPAERQDENSGGRKRNAADGVESSGEGKRVKTE